MPLLPSSPPSTLIWKCVTSKFEIGPPILYQGGDGGRPEPTWHSHPGVELRANLKSISHRCHLFEVAFIWELTQETIDLPLGCLQGGGTEGGSDKERNALPWRAGAALRTVHYSPLSKSQLAQRKCTRGPFLVTHHADFIGKGFQFKTFLAMKFTTHSDLY